MIIEETFTIDAPLQAVWDFFLDIERMARCMPGAEVKQTDPSTYEGELKVKVGPIGASFGGAVTIMNQTAPTSVSASVKAKDKMTGSIVQGEFSSAFKSLGARQTEVSYKIDVAIRGKMGTFGQAVMQDTAKRLSAEFLSCVKDQIETPEDAAPPPPLSSGRAAAVAFTAFFGALFSALFSAIRKLFRRKSPTGQP